MTVPAPSPRVRVVLDTDTYNEVDDQFALAHLLLSGDRVALEAVYAAPFYCGATNPRAQSPAHGMEQSFDEIERLLHHMGRRPAGGVFRGSPRFLADARTPVDSAAARDLVQRALERSDERLHVCAIAAPTNVASALLMEPRIADRISIVWLGGHAPYWPDTAEFNLRQDVHASRVLLDSSAPLVVIPCHPVASHLITTVAELEKELAPFSELGRYLTGIVRAYRGAAAGTSKVIWDIAASSYFVNPDWLPVYAAAVPGLRDDLTWGPPVPGGPVARFVRSVDRDAIFADFFSKARALGEGPTHKPGAAD